MSSTTVTLMLGVWLIDSRIGLELGSVIVLSRQRNGNTVACDLCDLSLNTEMRMRMTLLLSIIYTFQQKCEVGTFTLYTSDPGFLLCLCQRELHNVEHSPTQLRVNFKLHVIS